MGELSVGFLAARYWGWYLFTRVQQAAGQIRGREVPWRFITEMNTISLLSSWMSHGSGKGLRARLCK